MMNMTMTFRAGWFSAKSFAFLATCSLLAACGGGGGGGGANEVQVQVPTSDDYIRLSNTSSTGETPLGYVAINNVNRTSSGYAGMLDHDGGTVNGGLLVGAINNSRTRVTLSGGETADLSNPANNLHARLFSTSGLPNDLFGVVGQYTNLDDVPDAGSSTFNGTVELQADNGNATFALTGDAMITVAWDAVNDVDSVFDDLDGVRNDGVGPGVNVQDVGTITITDATLNGTSFSGGTFSTTGDDLAYTGGGTQVNAGQFFGPEATEVGGVFGLNAPNELELSGVFIARGGRD